MATVGVRCRPSASAVSGAYGVRGRSVSVRSRLACRSGQKYQSDSAFERRVARPTRVDGPTLSNQDSRFALGQLVTSLRLWMKLCTTCGVSVDGTPQHVDNDNVAWVCLTRYALALSVTDPDRGRHPAGVSRALACLRDYRAGRWTYSVPFRAGWPARNGGEGPWRTLR